MTGVTEEQGRGAIAAFRVPYLDMDLISARMLKELKTNGAGLNVSVELGFACGDFPQRLSDELTRHLETTLNCRANVQVVWKVTTHAVQKGVKPYQNIKNTIAVASGKGGVGKSTTAVNLALALAADGAVVGILDADIYGPSQPRMLGQRGKADVKSRDGRSMDPITAHGIQSMSIGYLIDEESPMIWRGPMVTQALEQLLRDTNWQALDYLVIDLPPGTGDTQLTLAQKIPVTGALIVTTPQDIALLDARKGLKMFQKVEIPVLGIVENMATYICPNCGHEEHIFGSGGGARMAQDYDVEMIGSLPLNAQIREDADNGNPTVVANPSGPVTHAYREIARRVAAKLSLLGRDYSSKFPNIVIQNT